MDAALLVPGRLYAYREKRVTGVPFLKVTYLEKVPRPGKIKIRFEDGPHPGLEDYANTRQLVVPWGERNKVLRDEKNAERLAEHAEKVEDKTLGEAASAVFESTGENLHVDPTVTSIWDPESLQRVLDRAGLDKEATNLHPLGYVDRHGHLQLPLDGLLPVAQAFAAAEPRAVLDYIDEREEDLRHEALIRHDSWWNDYRRSHAPAWALARRWANPGDETAELRKEIARLRAIVGDAAGQLRDLGKSKEARALLRRLELRHGRPIERDRLDVP